MLTIQRSSTQTLEPEWDLVTKSLGSGKTVSVDCESNLRLCQELDVVSFPAIRLYHQHDQMTRYRGPRAAKEYVPMALIVGERLI